MALSKPLPEEPALPFAKMHFAEVGVGSRCDPERACKRRCRFGRAPQRGCVYGIDSQAHEAIGEPLGLMNTRLRERRVVLVVRRERSRLTVTNE
jgi:hypothetical protein